MQPGTRLQVVLTALLIVGLTVFIPSTSKAQQNTMKEYVLLVRLNPEKLTKQNIDSIHAGWDRVLAEWKAGHHYLTGSPVVAEGLVIQNTSAPAEKGAIYSDGLRIISIIHLAALNEEEAVRLARMAPILAFGGNIEIRTKP